MLAHEDKQWIDTQIETRLAAQTGKLTEFMRDMQTEILRGFATHEEAILIRLHKLKPDHRSVDTAATGRLDNL
jgi:hypothetical protein